jgi:ABC-type antimicrobial peptide transport system permease subunit
MVATFLAGEGGARMSRTLPIKGGEVTAVWLRTTAQLRGRVQLTVLLALLVGLAGGLVLAALAGARRSDAALPHFLAFNQTTDAMVWVVPRSGSFFDDRSHLGQERRVVAGLPGVRSTTRGSVIIVSGTDPASPAGPRRQTAVVALDPGGGDLAGRPMVIAGRLAREDRADEATIDEELAQRRGLRVGSTYRIGTYTMAQFGPVGEGVPIQPDGPTVELRITGIVRHPNDLTPPVDGNDDFDTDETSGLYLTPTFWHRYGPDLAKYGIFISVDLERGPDRLAGFTQALQRRFGDRAFINNAFDEPGDAHILGTQRAITLETAALLGFAALAALAGVLLVGQTLARQVLLEAAEYPTLRALGMTRGQLVVVALIRAVVVAGGGAAIAVATAVVLSPLTPIGVGRRAELDPGIAVDQPVLAVGGVAIILLVAVCAALPAWRAARAPGTSLGVIDPASPPRSSRLAGALTSVAARPSVVTGVRLALEPGRGRTAVPVRAAMAGAAAAVVAITLAAVFAASLAHLGRTPSGYGVSWDLGVGNFADATSAQRVGKLLAANPALSAVAGLVSSSQPAQIDGHSVPIAAFQPRKGVVSPTVIEGREPLRPDEIALGSLTMRTLGKRLHDTVTFNAGSQPRQLRVVGRVVLNEGGYDSLITPGTGAVVHLSLYPPLPGTSELYPTLFVVRFAPGADRSQAIARLRADFGGTVIGPRPHSDVRNVQRIGYLPGLLAVVVALLAVGTVAHALVSSVRRRRRDLAILKTLGFVRRQVSATVAWQATTFALMAVLVGLPLGIAAGRWAWRLTAEQLGVASPPISPPLPILAIATGAVVTANLIAAPPGWVAGRLRPALVLHSE